MQVPKVQQKLAQRGLCIIKWQCIPTDGIYIQVHITYLQGFLKDTGCSISLKEDIVAFTICCLIYSTIQSCPIENAS